MDQWRESLVQTMEKNTLQNVLEKNSGRLIIRIGPIIRQKTRSTFICYQQGRFT